ncbi:MAG: SDR family oxidoreductase [Actinobacteria bacterium]|nr:SDR family oxidoreductase [Actinomycetota bacterium]
MFSLDKRVALVTGAATGIGQIIAVHLCMAGTDIAISDKPGVSMKLTERLCRPYGRKVFKVEIDIRDISQIRSCIKRIEKEMDHIDILVNNAGINKYAPIRDVTLKNWDNHFNTNVRGGFFCAQAVLGKMIERQYGRIIFISSQSGLIGIPGQAVYCGTKGALVNMVRSMGVECAKYNITVNSIAPTFIETNFTRKRLKNKEFLAFVKGKIPCGKLAEREDVANAVVYLASEEAKMVNCHTLAVDGGWSAW